MGQEWTIGNDGPALALRLRPLGIVSADVLVLAVVDDEDDVEAGQVGDDDDKDDEDDDDGVDDVVVVDVEGRAAGAGAHLLSAAANTSLRSGLNRTSDMPTSRHMRPYSCVWTNDDGWMGESPRLVIDRAMAGLGVVYLGGRGGEGDD